MSVNYFEILNNLLTDFELMSRFFEILAFDELHVDEVVLFRKH
jgi:hypothetical protein